MNLIAFSPKLKGLTKILEAKRKRRKPCIEFMWKSCEGFFLPFLVGEQMTYYIIRVP